VTADPDLAPRDIENIHALRLSVDEESALCDRLAELDAQLAAALTALGADVSPDGNLGARREQRARAVRALRGRSEPVRRARRLQRALDRLLWRLALSGMDQVTHLLRQRSYQRVGRDELRQAGLLGLHNAARRFESRRGVRFSTYCRYWVRDAMGDTVGRLEYAARLPGKARRQLSKDRNELSPRQARALSRVRNAVDLDAPAGDDDAQRQGDLLTGERARWSPELRTRRQRRLSRLRRALDASDLSDRDRYVLTQRFGLGTRESRTNRELGDELGISSERVRQLQKRALKQLRRAYQAA